MNRQHSWSSLIKETVILTAAVAIIAAAVYFFLLPSHASVSSISGLGIVLSNFIPLPLVRYYHDPECSAPHHRIFYLWQRIRSKDRIYQRHAAAVSRPV